MYLNHFGLNQPPFGITPNPSFFFAGNKRGEILDALLYAVTHGEGIIKVTGEVGSGKTMLCRMLESQLPENVEVIYLVNPTLTREQVVYAISGELGLAAEGKRVDEVLRLLQSDLIAKHIAGKQVVLLIEEAQAMPLNTLEEIRLLSNLETAHHKLMQIVLFGQPELDENLNLARMRQLKERITHSFKVPPLAPANIPEYLMFRLRAAGYHGPDIFSRASTKLISSVSEGIVRRISILADKSLLAAFSDNSYAIKPKHVRAAIEDSEFPKTALRIRDTRAIVAALSLVLLVAAIAGWRLFWVNASAATVPILVPPTPIVKNFQVNVPAEQLPAPAVVASNTPANVIPIEPAAPLPQAIVSRVKVLSPASVDLALRQRLERTDSWLNQQSQDNFSIQINLIASGDQNELARALRKIESETGLSDVYVYEAHKASGSQYGIVFGSYGDRTEALNKLWKLAQQWGYRLQLRTIGGIKKEIARANHIG